MFCGLLGRDVIMSTHLFIMIRPKYQCGDRVRTVSSASEPAGGGASFIALTIKRYCFTVFRLIRVVALFFTPLMWLTDGILTVLFPRRC